MSVNCSILSIMNTYKSTEFKKIPTPFPYGNREKQYYKHKKEKFKLVFINTITDYEKHIGVPSQHVAHVCSKDGEPYHSNLRILDPGNMPYYKDQD